MPINWEEVAENGNVEAVRAFIREGGDVNQVDGDGNTPLRSVMAGHRECENDALLEILNLLIDAGADVNHVGIDQVEIIDEGADVNHVGINQDQEPQEPILYGALDWPMDGLWQVIEIFVRGGLNVHFEDEEGMTLLLKMSNFIFDFEDEVEVLIEAGADVNHAVNGWTALLLSAQVSNFNVFRALLEGGADPFLGLGSQDGDMLTVIGDDLRFGKIFLTAMLSLKQAIGEELSPQEIAALNSQEYDHVFATTHLEGRSKKIAWKKAIGQELDPREVRFVKSEAYDHEAAEEFLQERSMQITMKKHLFGKEPKFASSKAYQAQLKAIAERVVDKLKNNIIPTDDELTLLNDPKFKHLAAFQELEKYLSAVIDVSRHAMLPQSKKALPADVIKHILSFDSKERAVEIQSHLMKAGLKNYLTKMKIQVNGENHTLTSEETDTSVLDRQQIFDYYRLASTNLKTPITFAEGEEINLISLFNRLSLPLGRQVAAPRAQRGAEESTRAPIAIEEIVYAMEGAAGNLIPYDPRNAYPSIFNRVEAYRDANGNLIKKPIGQASSTTTGKRKADSAELTQDENNKDPRLDKNSNEEHKKPSGETTDIAEEDTDLDVAIAMSLEWLCSSQQESDSSAETSGRRGHPESKEGDNDQDMIVGYVSLPEIIHPEIYGYDKQDNFYSTLSLGSFSKQSESINLTFEKKKTNVDLSAEVKKFFESLDHNDIGALQEMIAQNPSLVNATDADGMSALAHANAFGHATQVNMLLEHNAYAHEFESVSSILQLFVNNMLDYMSNIPGYAGMLVGALSSMQSYHITTKNIDQY